MPNSVVNYFQNLYLCDFQQPDGMDTLPIRSCELLSKFVPFWFPTTCRDKAKNSRKLWITFKICTFVISNNRTAKQITDKIVVNYFQNLYLCDFQQLNMGFCSLHFGCELLSKFVPLWFPTTPMLICSCTIVLWITFKICTFVISNNTPLRSVLDAPVVNYFQNLYLCDFQQHISATAWASSCCELLSKFVPLWFPTTEKKYI